MIVQKYHPEMKVGNFKFVRGRVIEGDQTSRALYGIVSTKKNLVLRVHIRKELAEIYANDDSRHIEEIFLKPV